MEIPQITPTLKPDVIVFPVIAPTIEVLPADRVPCNWTLKEESDGLYSAVNSQSGSTFQGTIEDFNNHFLRSK